MVSNFQGFSIVDIDTLSGEHTILGSKYCEYIHTGIMMLSIPLIKEWLNRTILYGLLTICLVPYISCFFYKPDTSTNMVILYYIFFLDIFFSFDTQILLKMDKLLPFLYRFFFFFGGGG